MQQEQERCDQVAQKSGGETAYSAVIEALRSGALHPGDRLREEDIAARFGLSRTPVREALRRLEAEGIVQHRPRQGAVIRRLSQGELVELYEMRIVLERTAAEMAAKHGSAAEFDTLEALNARIAAERGNPAQAAAINQSFHANIYLAGRNQFLVEAARGLNNALLLMGPTTFTDAARIDTVVAQHDAIISALKAGDVAASGEAAAAHLETSLRQRLKALAE